MAESQSGRTPQHGPWAVGRHAVPMPPSDAHRTPPSSHQSQEDTRAAGPSPGTKKTLAVGLEPLANRVADTERIQLAPLAGDRADARSRDWTLKATRDSTPVPARTAPGSPWFRVVLLLLMLVLLSAVAFWTPARLQTLAASTMELFLSTDIPESRTAAGPGPLVGQLDVTSAPSGIELFVDGTLRGLTPMQLVVNAGTHELTFVSPIGQVRRQVRVRPGHRTLFSEAIFPGSLVISSEAEIEVRIDGRSVDTIGDYRKLLAPGSYEVELVNLRNGAHSTHWVEVFPGRVTTFDARADS